MSRGSMKKTWFLMIISILLSCSRISPISGLYQTKDGRLSANVLDSTLFLMIGIDTMIIYDLKIHYTLQEDSNIFRIYHVLYYKSLNRSGYRSFEIPIRFEYDLDFGGTLMVQFKNNDSFYLGGYWFYNQRNENGNKIFDNWNNLYLGNTETKLRLNFQE
jgi:hypothetical protein